MVQIWDTLWWLGIVHIVGSVNEPFVFGFLDGPGLVKVIMCLELDDTVPSAERFPPYLQYRKSSAIVSRVRHDGDRFRQWVPRS